jgi:hypothetical protein
MIYLNESQSSIKDCYFKGFNNSNSEYMEDENPNELCPNNPLFFSSNDYAIVYSNNGTLKCENDTFE